MPEGATLEQLQAAPVGARAVTGDDRVIGKTEEGWKVIGFISKASVRDADVVGDKATETERRQIREIIND